MVIDTPGMRELGMWKAGEGIEHTFSDIEKSELSVFIFKRGHKRNGKK